MEDGAGNRATARESDFYSHGATFAGYVHRQNESVVQVGGGWACTQPIEVKTGPDTRAALQRTIRTRVDDDSIGGCRLDDLLLRRSGQATLECSVERSRIENYVTRRRKGQMILFATTQRGCVLLRPGAWNLDT